VDEWIPGSHFVRAVALQWQTGMHGFEQAKLRREKQDAPAGAVPVVARK